MNKGVVYYTKIREEYQGKNMEHMLGERLLETALKETYGLNLYQEPRMRGEHGKPFFTLRPRIHYNISHSGEYVVCILAPEEVGIDVQIHRKVNYERMLERMVPASMIPEILQEENITEAFFTQWVLREAYIKWTGEGLSRNLPSISLEEGWHELFQIAKGYSGAIYGASPLELAWECRDITLV